jgi:hypothetical protein
MSIDDLLFHLIPLFDQLFDYLAQTGGLISEGFLFHLHFLDFCIFHGFLDLIDLVLLCVQLEPHLFD